MTVGRRARAARKRLRVPEHRHERDERVLPIALGEQGPIEDNAWIADAEYSARLSIVSSVPVPGVVIGIDAHFLRFSCRNDLHSLSILARVTPRQRPRAADARADRHRMTVLGAPNELRLRRPLTVGPLGVGNIA